MCGISGFNWKDKKLVSLMNAKHAFRGPDDQGVFVGDKLSLGHRRLSILDLSSKGHQPMYDRENSMVLVFNGEIYNFSEINKYLQTKGYQFDTKSDSETIIYAYKHWGSKCIEKFIGMFAFALYDLRKEELFLARDHIGIKPLYFYLDSERFIFSSTIPPILLHDIKTKPNKKAIRDFLLYNITDHLSQSFFKNIFKFPKGHYALYNSKDNKIKFTKWFDIKFSSKANMGYDESVNEFRKRLNSSIDYRLISDVPVGTCLSGGLDSTSIACLINDKERDKIKTFSAVYKNFSKDESKYIHSATSKAKFENKKIFPSSKEIAKEIFSFVNFMAEPVPTPSPYAQYKVFQLAAKNNTTVLLDGQGADELLAGYHYFHGFYLRGLIKKRKYITVFKEIKNLVKGGNSKLGLLSLIFLFLPNFIKRDYFANKSNISNSLLNDKSAKSLFFLKYYSITTLHKSLEFHLDYKLEHLLKWEDRNSMAHSCEARVPFLDINFMKFIFTLPENFIINNGCTKKLMRDSMSGIVPDDIRDRSDKIGFSTPESDWIQDKYLVNLLDELFIHEMPLSANYINLVKTRKIISSRNLIKYSKTIWKTLFLEVWLRQFSKELNI